MISLLVAAQLAAAVAPDTATYSSPAVRSLVTEAARLNARVPPSLGRYRATLESEVSYGGQQGSGRELSVSIEQMASDLTWTRTGDFEQHVTGYRSQSVGPQLATLGFFRYPWVVPALYGNRLALLFGRDTVRRSDGRGGRGTAAGGATAAGKRPVGERVGGLRNPQGTSFAVHPLAADRERVYRFSGGDTVENLRVGERLIRIVKIEVTPKLSLPPRTAVFSGEVDLDLERKHVVRMRGSFATTGEPPSGPLGLLKPAQLEGVVFVELVNSEMNQEYWLPATQRFEAQAMAATFGDGKAVFRIVSRFRNYEITPSEGLGAVTGAAVSGTAGVSAADTLRPRPHVLSVAPRDSLARFDRWRDDIGAQTAEVRAEDFTDLAPPRWRADGPPLVLLQAERLSDLMRVNRIEGLFTGLGVSVRLRDAAPGVTLRALGGFAWSEQTMRGRVSAELKRGAGTYTLRAARSLDLTNDFRNPFDSGSTLGALFGTDDYDYADRRSAGVAAVRALGKSAALARVEVGWADDRAATPHLTRGPLSGALLRANRGVDEGSYLRTAVTLEWHPDASAEFMRPGSGAALSYLRGDGALRFQRAELRLSTRRNAGRWTFAARADAGAVFGSPPPQQLFELGSTESLPGYEYKEFAGGQAAVLKGIAMYRLDLWNAPIQLTQRFWLPAVAPALGVSVQGGWTGASGDAARAAMRRLGNAGAGTADSALSSVTGNARVSVAVGIRFFGGAVGVVAARPVDHAAPWRVRLEFGQLF